MTAPAQLQTTSRIDDIECLRAVAVLGVLAHHLQGPLFYWNPAWLGSLFKHAAFWSGVDLFFAISGFVIARSLLPQLAAGVGNAPMQRRVLMAFWTRRAFRLLPSAWLWLALIMLAVLLFNQSGVFGTVRANVWATLAGLANVANFRFADAFMRYEYGASFIYWTLSLEEQFYVLLPLLAWLLRRHLAWLLIALIIVQAWVMRTPLLMSVRTDALAWGVLLAMAYGSAAWQRLDPALLGRRWLRYPVLLLLFGALAALSADTNGFTLHWRIALIAVLCTILVWIASYGRGYICAEGPLKTVLMWIGSRSYAIYLVHVPVYFLVRESYWRMGFAGNPPPAYSSLIYATTAMLLIALLAEANYRWVEKPLRSIGVRIANRIVSGSSKTQANQPSPASAL